VANSWEKDAIVEAARWEADPVVRLASASTAAAKKASPQGEPLIVLGAGLPVPDLLRKPANPNSAGHYPLGRRYTPGDESHYRLTSPHGLFEGRDVRQRVTHVDVENDRVELNGGRFVRDLMGNPIRYLDTVFDKPPQFFPAELYVGRRWTSVSESTVTADTEKQVESQKTTMHVDFEILAREAVSVPAGTFEAFRIRGYGGTKYVSLEEHLWVVPWLNFGLRWDRLAYRPAGKQGWRYTRSEHFELVSARQFAIDA
jgi:hypothetical protein